MGAPSSFRARMIALATSAAVVAAALVSAGPAVADSAPIAPTTPTTVAADSLPTAQINGVVWSQVIVGNTVYVAGQFTRARPAGSAAGTNEVVRNNVMAYNLTTGVMTAFNPNLNGTVRALVASADGTRLYAGGAFTTVGGVTRTRLAAFDTITGGLVGGWTPTTNATVNALAITSTAVYAGGAFSSASGQARTKIAAFSASNGAIQPWAGTVTGGSVNALTASPDGTKVILGGSFTAYNGGSDPGYGMAATDATTGASLIWKVNSIIRNGGPQAAILGLSSSAAGVFGVGYVFGSGGNHEGTFRASWEDGTMIWLEDCHGDTYSSVPVGDIVYTTGHVHYCGNIDGFPQLDPWTYHRTLAFTMEARGTITADPLGYPNFEGAPRPDLLTFYPDINSGTFTGQGQGPWTITANDQYVLYGGEFTIVNNKGQQGLSRFAVKTIAPNKEGPRVAAVAFVAADFVPAAASFIEGTVRLAWKSAYDRDNENLTYEVLRDNVVVQTIVAPSTDWRRPNLNWNDTGLTPGQTYSYRIRVTDAFGNTKTGNPATVEAADAGSLSDYAETVLGDSPRSYWPLGEASGSIAFDWPSGIDATTNAGVTRNVPGAVIGDSGTASRFNGGDEGYASTSVAESPSNNFSVEAWVKTTTTQGGKIVGFGNSAVGNSSGYDRHIYMDNDGKIWFGIYNGDTSTLNTSTSFNDGEWHQIVASLGSNGMGLYVDGKKVASRGDVTTGQDYDGYWRIGGDNLGWWDNQPASNYIAADIDEVAVYTAPLSAQQILDHYVASGRTSPFPPTPADAYGAAVYNAEPELYWRLGEAGGTVAADASRAGNPGTYSGTYSQGESGLISGIGNTSATFNGGIVSSTVAVTDPRGYTLEAWFETTTTQGGKLIGFGNEPTAMSSNYDRHVYMQDDGRLVFGTYTGALNTATTANAYNDGQRHHLVATQAGDGMKLYVDGVLAATNPQTEAQGYTGYWKIGGDPTWGSSSPFFAGKLDEVAVYATPLTAIAVANHYSLGTTGVPANLVPSAAFGTSLDHRDLSVDASASSDPDGSITGYAWNWGDGGTATGMTASHTYAIDGDYVVSLTVTDNNGATNTVTKTVSALANALPLATFTHSESGLGTSVDGSASTDPDGTVVGYAWAWGDGATDTGATASHTYAGPGKYTVTLTVTDDGGSAGVTTQEVTIVPPVPTDAYGAAIYNADPELYWRLGDQAGTVAVDSGRKFQPGTYSGSVAKGQAGLVTGSESAVAFADGLVVSDTLVNNPTVYSVEGWFKTTSTSGGKLIGFGNAQSGTSSAYDRHLYMSNDGTLTFGTWTGFTNTVTTPTAYNDGERHHAVATQSSQGIRLYVDGVLIGTNSQTEAQDYAGYWRIGGDNHWGCCTPYFNGTLDEVAVYSTALSAATVADHYALGVFVAPANVPPSSAFGTSMNRLVLSVDGSASSDSDGTVTGYAWTFGDGSTGTGMTQSHTYAVAGIYDVTLTVTDNNGATHAVTKQVTATENAAPVAAFTHTETPLTTAVDATSSTDSDGTITGFAWTFGDGGTATGVTASHGYAAAGDYTVTLTATDNEGGTHAVSQTVTVVAPENVPPSAAFGTSIDRLALSVDGSASSDSDGTVTGYAWTFGDGGTANGVTASHNYTTVGTYDVTLTVTDNNGGTHSVTKQVAATENSAPVAAFTHTETPLSTAVDASASADPDGTVAGYAWTFGDGATAAGVTASHGYAVAGDYTVTLTVTDNEGGTHAVSQTVTVDAPANAPPTAAFTHTETALAVAVDGGTSTDSDGTVTGYDWTFGDGATGTGATASHSYAAAGTYTVTLTVTDNGAATGTTSQQVTVAAPAAGAFAQDAFERTTVNGLGIAEIGGPWTMTGSATNYSVSDGTGRIRAAAGAIANSYLAGVASTDTDLSVTMSLLQPATGSGAYVSMIGRRVGTDDYRARVKVLATGVVQLQLLHGATTMQAANVAGLTYATGDQLRVRVQVVGTAPTTIRAKVWRLGQAEPAAWLTSTTNATAAMQSAGSIGLAFYLGGTATTSPVTVAFDNLIAQPTGPAPANVAPTAAFTSATTNLSAEVNGSSSTDSDGTIASYAWTFGDGGTGTGATASHAYATSGTYPVQLTVTDNGGLTSNVTHSVTVTTPVPGAEFARDEFERTTATGLGAADLGGPWTVTGSAANYSVGAGVGQFRAAAGSTVNSYLSSVSSSNTEVSVTAGLSQAVTGGGAYVSILGRRVGTGDYRARVKLSATGVVDLQIQRGGTTLQTARVAGLTYATGDQLQVKLQVFGTSPTTIRAKIWKVGTTEPAVWQVSTTDATAAMQVAGSIGLSAYMSASATVTPVTITFDSLVAKPAL